VLAEDDRCFGRGEQSLRKAAEPTDTDGSADYLPHPLSASDLEVMRRLNRRHLQFPFGFFYQAVVV